MIQCPTCKTMHDDSVRFCPNDGTPLTDTSASRTELTPTNSGRPASAEIKLPVLVGAQKRYRLEELRGGGGMAKVYKATDLTLEREVAVKLINPELRSEEEFDKRFEREAKIASQLIDPHIVVVHDYGLDEEYGPFLVMEYLQGQSLRERLTGSGPLPLKAGLQLAGQLLLALIHAHGKGIVHRDIKPDNIFLLNQSGVRLHVRVLDFGIARIYRRDEGTGRSETITLPGSVLGTPRYMSPEQLAGQPVDVKSDLYSAAMVIHEALTGQLPYVSGKTLCELCPEATPALQELLDQCLKPNPSERPPTAVEVYLRLQELGKASGVLLLPPGAMERLVAARKQNEPTVEYKPKPKGLGRRILLLSALGLVAVLGLVLGGWWLTRPRKPTGPPADGERLLGVKVGDAQGDVVEQLGLTRISVSGDPWKQARTKVLLGRLLAPADLGLDEKAMQEVEVHSTSDNRVCVVFHANKVRAMVAQRRGVPTAGGLRVGDDVNTLYETYPQREGQEVHLGDNVGRRYDRYGVGFEIEGHTVRAITLYPKKSD